MDSPSGTPNYCYEPSISVEPYEVIDGKIQFTGGMGVYWSGCIEINVQKDSKGRVGYAKGCGYSWDECVEWDENWEECLRTETVYMDCAEIEVYRIGKCYEDLDEFKEFVYSKCPNVTPPYPNLWQTWYGRKYTSEAAQNCIYKNWDVNNDDSWYSYAYFKYIPKATFHWQRYDGNIRIETNSQIGHNVEVGRYNWCDGECRAWNDSGCTDCDGTIHEEIYYDWIIDANAHIVYNGAWGGTEIWTGTWNYDCTRESWEPECKCINAYNQGSAEAFSGLNPFVNNYLGNTSNYGVGEDNRTNGTCFDKSYQSKFEPNECWASWWYEGINRLWCYYGKVTIEKWNNKVEYNGVKLRIYAIQKNGNSQGGNHPLSVDHTATVIYDTEMDVRWGQEFTFPIANNIIGISIYDPGHCVNYGDYSQIRYFPYDSGCDYCSTVEIHIQVIGTI